MTEEELREKIAHIIFGEDTDPVAWGDFKSITEHYLRDADHILALIKEAGYVKLAEDQSLPINPFFELGRLKYRVWRKVILDWRE